MANRGHSSHSGGSHGGGSHGSGGFHGGGWRRPYGGRTIITGPIFFGNRDYSDEAEHKEPTPEEKRRMAKHAKTVGIVCACFAALFIILSIFAINITYGKTVGTVVSYEKIGDYYYTTYRYEINGQEYITESQTGWTNLPAPADEYIGQEYELYFRRIGTYEIYEIEDGPNLQTYRPLFLFATFIFGVIALINLLQFNTLKHELSGAESVAVSQEPKVKGKCSYCGAKNKEDSAKCDNCGAPLND